MGLSVSSSQHGLFYQQVGGVVRTQSPPVPPRIGPRNTGPFGPDAAGSGHMAPAKGCLISRAWPRDAAKRHVPRHARLI